MRASNPARRWGYAWLALATTLALHVADEAVTGFLPFYNALVRSLQESWYWVPLPTFTFPAWIGGLVVGIAVLFALSPLVFAGRPLLRPIAYLLGALMVLNALGNLAASLYLGTAVPGVYSSPLLFVAAVALLVTTYSARAQPVKERAAS